MYNYSTQGSKELGTEMPDVESSRGEWPAAGENRSEVCSTAPLTATEISGCGDCRMAAVWGD